AAALIIFELDLPFRRREENVDHDERNEQGAATDELGKEADGHAGDEHHGEAHWQEDQRRAKVGFLEDHEKGQGDHTEGLPENERLAKFVGRAAEKIAHSQNEREL